MIQSSNLCDEYGTVLTADGHVELGSVSREEAIGSFREGALLLRGFRADVGDFREFVERMVTEPVFHPNYQRKAAQPDRAVLLVDPNEVAIPAHSELAYTPLCPELIFFYCVRPAEKKGESTVYDGLRALELMEATTRDTFYEKRLKWSMVPHLPKTSWAPWLGVDDIAGATARLELIDDLQFEFDSEEGLYYEYLVSAIQESRLWPGDSFSNSCLLGSPKVVFEDGSEISQDLRWDALDATESVAVEVPWQVGDVVMLDNIRYMHGRRGFPGHSRSIASMLGNANF